MGRNTFSCAWITGKPQISIMSLFLSLATLFGSTNVTCGPRIALTLETVVCRYVAPEYARTGHLLGKSDVLSYGVALLELLSGRKPVDVSQPQGQENLVTWARPLMTSREGLEKLVDPCLGGNYNFDNMAKVAAIASMCVNPEAIHGRSCAGAKACIRLHGGDV